MKSFLSIFHSRGEQVFSGKGQIENVCFAFHTDSVMSAQLCHRSVKAAIDGPYTDHRDSVIEASFTDTEIGISHHLHTP